MSGLNPGLVNKFSGSVSTLETSGLMPEVYDTINCNYAGSTADVYTYYSLGVLVATLTVNWTTSGKTVLSSIVRT